MKIKKNVKVRSVGGENIILLQGTHGLDTTKIVSLNETSLWLWERFADSEFDVGQVAEALASEFGIDKALAEKDAAEWVDMMIRNRLIEQ